MLKKFLFACFILTCHSLCGMSLKEQFIQFGYHEIDQEKKDYDRLYRYFDELIEMLQSNKALQQKLYNAKERYIRSKERHLYMTDYMGLFDESEKEGKRQISFYYSIHFHTFLFSNYPELRELPPLACFFAACLEIQTAACPHFENAVNALELGEIFSLSSGQPPILIKVVKYLSSYFPRKPHYDGTALTLFLDSTDDSSLYLSPYKPPFKISDFILPKRAYKHSILLIPGSWLKEFKIEPTPHIVLKSDKTRYAAVAFLMRPYFKPASLHLAELPEFSFIE
ncbi:MAG: hypothetical protein ACK4HV_04240 [Parachlamydiaceae bacterium]